MTVEQMYTSCLSEAAYFIAHNGEAAVIDPLRDVDLYIQKAEEEGLKIKYVFETHFHADFVSGHLDLSKKAGCQIVYGPNANPSYPVYNAKDGEEFSIGGLTLRVIHTPGHTLESTCYLLLDESGKEHCLFTGDTLFVGDVGRPDLMDGLATKEDLAALMYDSLNNKIKPLPDHVIIYPAHGPGSSCGKSLGSETFSTLGKQKETNYALQNMSKADFIIAVTEGLSEPPRHFPVNAKINREGYGDLDAVLQNSLTPLSIKEVKQLSTDENTIILDTRHQDEFVMGFIPDSVFIGLNGRYAEWFGMLFDFSTKVIIVAAEGKEKESITRLSRVGFDNVIGFLEGGFGAWQSANEEFDMVISIDSEEFGVDHRLDKEISVIDVRNTNEFEASHVENATSMPLGKLEENIHFADPDEQQYVYCAGGYRSVIAASIFKRHGFELVKNIIDGFESLSKESGVSIVSPVEHS